MKKIAVLPSLLTLGNAFCGFLAIVKAADAAHAHALGDQAQFSGCLETAVLLIFVAMIFDALDGKVARLTNQATDFGAQLDSLSDAVTFGVAPAAMAKVLIQLEGVKLMPFLQKDPRIHFLPAVVFALFAVMRLARFNVETASHEEDAHGRFKGLPTPAAGGFVAAVILFWLHRDTEIASFLPAGTFNVLLILFPWALVLAGLAMVSPLPYPHLANVLFKRRKSFPFLLTLILMMAFSTIYYEGALLAFTALFLLAGVYLWIKDYFGRRRTKGGSLLQGPRSASGW